MKTFNTYINEATSSLFNFKNVLYLASSEKYLLKCDSLYHINSPFNVTFGEDDRKFEKNYFFAINKAKSELYCFDFGGRFEVDFKFLYKMSKQDMEIFLKNAVVNKNLVTNNYASFIIYSIIYTNSQGRIPYDKFLKLFQSIQIPPEFKKAPTTILYRGLFLTEPVVRKIVDNKPFSLNPRKLTSWTINKQVAVAFAGRNNSIILRQKVADPMIIINFNVDKGNFYKKIIDKFAAYTSTEAETIVKGNGVISKPVKMTEIENIFLKGKQVK